ncbi:hypothetical protein FB45DRAFT_916416, partial [Roridomyces roridus]
MASSNPPSGRSSPYRDQEPTGHRFADDLEGQNDEQLEGLSAKVKLLKDVRESVLMSDKPNSQPTVHRSQLALGTKSASRQSSSAK